MKTPPTTEHNQRLTLGVLVGWSVYKEVVHPYLYSVFQGLRAAADAHGCNLLLACGMDDYLDTGKVRPAWPEIAPDSDYVPVGPWNTDGLIAITPIEKPRHAAYLQQLRAVEFPVVFVGAGEPGPTVMADNEGGIMQAMAHLAAHGHRRIAFIAGQDTNADNVLRLNAYHTAVHQYHLADDPALIVGGEGWETPSCLAVEQLLASDIPFTAILACNDGSALGALQALQRAGRRVPQDVAVVGFDNEMKALLTVPRLTTVHQGVQECGYQAVEYLLECIEGRNTNETVRKFPTRLVVRESCGCEDLAAIAGPFPAPGSSQSMHLLHLISEAAQGEARHLSAATIRPACQRLLDALAAALETGETKVFSSRLMEILHETEELEANPYLWLTALLTLADHLPAFLEAWQLPESAHRRASETLWQAQRVLMRYSQRHYSQALSRQGWVASEMGLLTAQLLAANDEHTVLENLIRYLPHLNIQNIVVGLFEAEGDDPVAWSVLHWRDSAGAHQVTRLPSREFPPPTVYSASDPFQLALWPLVMQKERYGFVAFDAAQIELSAPVVRELAYAIKSVRLYQQARRNQQLAEDANQLKTRFLSTISHELGTPLNVIMGFSQMLLEAEARADIPPIPSQYRADIQHIHANAEHLGWLIRDLLDLASSEAGQLRLVFEPLDLVNTLQVPVTTGAFLAQAKGLTWEAQIPERLPRLWGDRTRLRQVVLNLISNAVKFTSRGGVKLCVEVSADSITISIRDTGLGIALEEQQVIFDDFHQADRTSARGYGGMGLGLAICKRLVELHGGQIGVHSSGMEGSGSTFYFTLPILTHVSEPSVPTRGESTTLALLTRNAEKSAAFYAELQKQNYTISLINFDENPNWLAELLKALPGAVALDFDTAAGQGWEVLKVVREHPLLQSLPVFFYSPVQPDTAGAVLELDYLVKPLGADELAQAFARQGWAPTDATVRKTILIVDDNLTILEMHKRIVQTVSRNYQILTAENGRQALDILAKNQIDLVLLDLMMPEVSGFEVLETMRSQESTYDVPVIVLTAQALTEADMERLNRGVATILQKGVFSVQETVTRITVALERNQNLGSVAQRVVRQAMAYFHMHYAEPVSRDSVAQHVGVNADYLTRCFRQETGLTPMVYLNRYRIQRAKSLLASEKQNMDEIAAAVGFTDGKYFSYAFHRETGITPGAFRKAQK